MQPGQKITRLQGLGIVVLRVVTGYLFLASGAYKLFIADLTLNQQAAESLSGPIVLVSSVVELVCGAALMVGLLTRFVCIPLILLMLADILVMHPPYQLFGQDRGYEYAVLRLAASTALALTGSGRVALDNILASIRRGSKQ